MGQHWGALMYIKMLLKNEGNMIFEKRDPQLSRIAHPQYCHSIHVQTRCIENKCILFLFLKEW